MFAAAHGLGLDSGADRKGQRPGLGTGGPEVVEPLSWRQKHFRVIARTIGRREERELSVGVNKALTVD